MRTINRLSLVLLLFISMSCVPGGEKKKKSSDGGGSGGGTTSASFYQDDGTRVGNYLYVGGGTTGDSLRIYDISNAASPSLVGSLKKSGVKGAKITVTSTGSLAFLSGLCCSFSIIDVSNVSDPIHLKTISTGSQGVNNIAVSPDNKYIYVAVGVDLKVYDVSNTSLIGLIGTYDPNTYSTYKDLAVSNDGNTLFVATNSTTYGLTVLNVSTPSSPSQITTFPLSGLGKTIELSSDGNTAYIGAGTNIDIVNVTTPSSPSLINSYSITSSKWVSSIDVSSDGNTLYTTLWGDKFMILDITTPSSPSTISSYSSSNIHSVDVSGTNAFLTNGYSDLISLDISTPASPVKY